jgi:hypothetical protein
MKPPVGSRVMSEGKSGTVTAHRPGSMVDVRWDDKKYDMRTDAATLSVVRTNGKAKAPVFVAAVLDDVSKQALYNYWVSQPGAPAPLPVPKMSHMTIKFRPSIEEVGAMQIGKPVQLQVTGWAADDKIQAVAVEPVGVGSANAVPHVTFALADASVPPKLSNELFSSTSAVGRMAPGPTITARLGWSDGGTYHFNQPSLSSNPGPRGGLTESERSRLPDSAFALSGRRFPINDANHGRIALQYILAGRVAERDVNDVVNAVLSRWGDNREVRAFYEKHKKKLTRANVEKIHGKKYAANPNSLVAARQYLNVSYEDAPAYFAAEPVSVKLRGKKSQFEGRWVMPGGPLSRVSSMFGDAVADFMMDRFARGEKQPRLTDADREAIFERVNRSSGSPFTSLHDFEQQQKRAFERFEAFMRFFHEAPPAVQRELSQALKLKTSLRKRVIDVAGNPKDDVYDPAKEQFRAVVQGIYESLVRKELGLPYNAQFVSAGGKRLDAPLNDAEKRQLLSRAYAIGTRQGQKYGWLEEGTQTPTAKGRAAAQARLAEQEHAGENRQDYERTLAAVRKGGHFRVVTENVDGQARFVVQPRPPKDLIKIPEYRLSQKAAEQDARAAEAALSKSPKGVRLKANPFYVKDLGTAYISTDIEDTPEDAEPLEGETFQAFEARIGVPSESLAELGEWRGKVDTGDWLSPIPESLRKTKLTKKRVIEDFERFQDIVNADLPANDPQRGPRSKPKSMPGFINLTVTPGETLEQILKRGVPRKDLELVKEAMADNVLEHYKFGTFIEPPIREVYYTDPLGKLDGEFSAELRDHDKYVEGSSLYSFQGWRDRFQDDFLAGVRAFISLLDTGAMPEGQEALGAKFVFQTGEPEPYATIPLSELAALPPPPGERAVEAIAKYGKDFLKQNLYRLRIPRGLERMLFISPSALRLAVAAGTTDVTTVVVALKSLHSSLASGAWSSPQWARPGNELPPKFLGEYRGALLAEEEREKRAKAPRSSETPTRYEAGDTPQMRYLAARAVPPMVSGRDDLAVMQAQSAMSTGKRLLRDALVLEATARTNEAKVAPDDLEGREAVEIMRTRAGEMRSAGQEAIERSKYLTQSVTTATTTTTRLYGQAPQLAARVYSDVVAASNHAAWHFNFYRVAVTQRGLSAFYINVESERPDGSLECQVKTGGITTVMVRPSEKLTYKFNRKADRDAFIAQFVKPRTEASVIKRENRLELARALEDLKTAVASYKFHAVSSRGELTFAEMQFNFPEDAARLERSVARSKAILEKFKVQTVELPPRDYSDEYWEEKVLRDYAAEVKDHDAANRNIESLGGTSEGPLKELTPLEFERRVENARRKWEEEYTKLKREYFRTSIAPEAEPLATLVADAEELVGGATLTEAQRQDRIAALVKEIQSKQARYEQLYATEKAAGKHEGKVRGLSADRKDNPSDVVAAAVRDLRSKLSILDPSHPEAAVREDLFSIKADHIANLIDRPELSTLDAETIRQSGGVPVYKVGGYAPRQSEFDPPSGVWIPGHYESSTDKSVRTASTPSPLELTLDRMERLIAQQRREADSLPYALAIKPTGLNKGLQCGPVVSNSIESVPVLYHDPTAMLPGVKYDAVFADLPTIKRSYPDTVLAFAYLISQPDKGPLMERLRRAFGSPAVQEVTRQHFSMLDAKKAKKLKEAFDAFVSRQAAIFRFPSAAEAMANGKTEEAKKLSVNSRGLPLPAYLYAGIPASEARALAASPNAPPPIFNGPISLRSALASRQFNTHLNIMAKYPRFPGTESLHRKEDGTPKIFPVPYPPTAESMAKAKESAKYTFITDSIRVGEMGSRVSEIKDRPAGWKPPFRDSRKPASEYPKTWTSVEQMQNVLGQSDISSMMLSEFRAREAQADFDRAAREQDEIRARQSESERADEIAKARNEEAMRGRNMTDTIADDVLSPDALLGQADAVDLMSGRQSLLRARWFNVVATLRSMLRGKPNVEPVLDDLETMANTGNADELKAALRNLRSSIPNLPPKALEQIQSYIADLTHVVASAERSIRDPEITVVLAKAAKKVGRAKSVPAPRQKTMIAHEEAMPPVFWDIEYDPRGGADSPELYVLYVDTGRYRIPKFARYLSGDLVRRKVPTRLVRSKGGVGGGLGTAGLYGQTQETVELQNRLAAAKAHGDTKEQKEVRKRLNEISRYARDIRAAAQGYVSDLVVEGFNKPVDAIQNRLSRFTAPSPDQQAAGLTEEQKGLYRGIAERTGVSYEQLIANALKRQREAAAAIKSLGRQSSANLETGWVYEPKFSRIMRSANKAWDPDGGKYNKFKFSIANYARFVTKNPLVLLATIRYWDAPQLVTGMVIALPGGRTVELPGAFAEPEGQASGYALPTDPSALLTELIEELKVQYVDAMRAGDVVTQAEIIRTLLGHESMTGLKPDEMMEEGLIALSNRLHSATGYTVPGRHEVPALSGVINGTGRLSIETGQPVGLRERPKYKSDLKIPFRETILGQIMSEDINLARAEGAERAYRRRLERAKKITPLIQDSAPGRGAEVGAFAEEEAQQEQSVPPVDTSKAAAVQFTPGMRIRMKGGRYSNGTGYVTEVRGGPAGTKDIVILMDSYRNRTSPFEITVNSLAASSLEILEGAPEAAEAEEEETRRPSSAESRKAAAGRAESARPGPEPEPEPEYSVGQNVYVTIEGGQYVSVITGTEGNKYIIKILRDLFGEEVLDDQGRYFEYSVDPDEIDGPVPDEEGFYEGDVVGNPRARRRAQKARANGSMRARLYVASRLMPTVLK